MTQFSYSQEYAELSKFYQLNNLTRLSEATASEVIAKAITTKNNFLSI